MRVALTRVLPIQPFLVLLDEPPTTWASMLELEEELKDFTYILAFDSHSQDFLNDVYTNIIHMHNRN